jgi:hypothetical protein
LQAGGYRFDPGYLHQTIRLNLFVNVEIWSGLSDRLNLIFDNFIEN